MKIKNHYRLNSVALFTRQEEQEREDPLKIVYLSVEGSITEKCYFQFIHKYRQELGIKRSVTVKVLERNDDNSAPLQVLELLEEFVQLQNSNTLPSILKEVIPKEYSVDFIKRYLSNDLQPSDAEEKLNFELILNKANLDIDFIKSGLDNHQREDIFAIVIDRDCSLKNGKETGHRLKELIEIYNYCKEKNYKFFITTPAFEFWLLIHTQDVSLFTNDELNKILENNRVSDKHTYTSKLLQHSKKISEKQFKIQYLPNVDIAIQRVQQSFCTIVDELIGNNKGLEALRGKLGSNLPDLFRILREK